VTKAFDELSLVPEAQELRANLAEWMKPVAVRGGALAAGNRVILKFPDLHVRIGIVLAKAVAARLSEDEVAVVLGDVETAREFSGLAQDHIVFTGSPAIGKVVAAAAARNPVPVTLELDGKNPAVTHRIAGTRMLNDGQICLCPDYVLVPSELHDEFAKLVDEFRALFPGYLANPGVVSIVNDRNYDRITGLIDDAVAKGATKLQVVSEQEKSALPSREGRRIPPAVSDGLIHAMAPGAPFGGVGNSGTAAYHGWTRALPPP
jgi:coniferyl-aldehyde dehydrogenase